MNRNKKLRAALLLSGLAILLPILGSYVLKSYSLTPRQFLYRLALRFSDPNPDTIAWLAPEPRYAEHVFDGRVKSGHPRILNLYLGDWNGMVGVAASMQERQRHFNSRHIDAGNPCASEYFLSQTVCWLVTGNPDAAERAIRELEAFRHETPDVQGVYGNAWKLALAYDLLARYPGMTERTHSAIQRELRAALDDYLSLLDEESPALWHGRTVLAANAWLCAIVLDAEPGRDRKYLVRAQGHFLDVMSGLGVTEAWPEGYDYWIRSRAFPLALAASAYLHGLEGSALRPDLLRIAERAGLWSIHAMRPDRRVEGLGDEGTRVDLQEETQRIMDLLANATGNASLNAFSEFLGSLRGSPGNYPGYGWGYALFHDPLSALAGEGREGAEGRHFERGLPTAQLFGRQAMNLVYIRSGWDPAATFISYHAGHTFAHHGHYDAGHFSLYKGAPLAVNGSAHADHYSQNRLNYSIRTVAKNSLLILRPGETVQPNRFFADNVADGGQRITLPTGSTIWSLDEWRENLYAGKHYEGAELLAYDHAGGAYTYVASDLTGAYNNTDFDDNGAGGKVSRVRRELLYLDPEDRLVIHDSVTTTDPAYQVKWLLHTTARPQVEQARVLLGREDNGILSSPARTALAVNAPGYLRLDWLLPREGEMRLVGGPDYRYYVEADGDETVLNGRNFEAGATEPAWQDHSEWRIELNAPRTSVLHEYLVVLSPGLKAPPNDAPRLEEHPNGLSTLHLAQSLLVFVPNRKSVQATLGIGAGTRHLYIVGDLSGKSIRMDAEALPPKTETPALLHVPFSGDAEHREHRVDIDG